MCYWVGTKNVREALAKKAGTNNKQEISQLFYADLFRNGQSPEIICHWVAIGKAKPMLTSLRVEEGKLQTANMQWTMPFAFTDVRSGRQVQYDMLNIMAEKILTSHKRHLAKRCIVPIDGYYEFFHKGRETFPYFIAPSDGGVFFVGALWNPVFDKQTGVEQSCLALITTPPNTLARQLHNNPKAPNGPRMLLLMDDRQAADFLRNEPTPDSIGQLLEPCPEDRMKAWPVVRFLNREFYSLLETAKIREPVTYAELADVNNREQLLF